MDYVIWLLSEMSLTEWARYIYDTLNKKMGVDATWFEEAGFISICCDYMTFFIHDELISIGVDVIKELYSFEANTTIRIQMFNRTFEYGMELLFMLMKSIIEEKTEDFLLLENGDEVVLERKGMDICTHIQKGCETYYRFELLGRDIKIV